MSDRTPVARPAERLTAYRLEIVSGSGAGATCEGGPGASLSIGRARDNTLVLKDAVISRHHAVIEPTQAGYRVRDVGSLAGVRRRGEPVSRDGVVLADGDLLDLGPVALRFRLLERKTTAATAEAPATATPPRPPTPTTSERAPMPSKPLPPREHVAARPEHPPAARELPPSLEPAAPTTGESFGVYRIVRSLRSSGPKLDLAVDTRTGAHVHLHRVPASQLGWRGRRRFTHDCLRTRTLAHGNIQVALEAGRLRDFVYVTYPHTDGVTVDELTREARRALTIPLAIYVACEVSGALAHLHDKLGAGFRAVVTTDRTLVSSTGRVVLLRVGTSLLPPTSADAQDNRFVAPEEGGNRAGDCRSAIFSLGVLLYELLAREPVDASQRLALRSIDTVRIDVAPSLAEATMRALEIAPEQRFASPGELYDLLTRELEDIAPGFSSTDAQGWMANRHRT